MRLIISKDFIKNLFCFLANCKVCFVALIQSFSHYNIVGQKLVNIEDLLSAVSEYVGHAGVSGAKAGLMCLDYRELSRRATEEIMVLNPLSEGLRQHLYLFY